MTSDAMRATKQTVQLGPDRVSAQLGSSGPRVQESSCFLCKVVPSPMVYIIACQKLMFLGNIGVEAEGLKP